MTEPHTFLPEWFRVRLSVSLERWHWEVAELDGERVLVPTKRQPGAPFRGHPDVLDRFVELKGADERHVARFVNRFTGVFALSGPPPLPERIAAIRSEALVLNGLRLIGRANLSLSKTAAQGLGNTWRPHAERTLVGAGAVLADVLNDLRPAPVRPVGAFQTTPRPVPTTRDSSSPEWQLLEWAARTIDEHWSLAVPIEEWLSEPMARRDRALARPMPEVRCLTLLGYAYAQLIAELQARTASASTLARRPHLCDSCGALLSERSPDGRRCRSDTRWCEECRRRKNADRQALRRRT